MAVMADIRKIRIKYFTRKKNESDLIETFKINDRISIYERFFSIFLHEQEI